MFNDQRIVSSYFRFSPGIAEGIVLHPEEQTVSEVGEKG